ncbi:MAG: hypothetical protein K0R98_1371 [Rickettsiaceae bacterium]|jgi:hypothetical protein|nr:hypothetical protein [Rickettsiaceae bacterium]
MRFVTKILALFLMLISLSAYAKEDTKKVILYPKFIITYAADFAAFKNYMNESKEEYRLRRASELVAQSKGTMRQRLTFNNQTINEDGYHSSQSTSDVTTTFADPQIMLIMMKAYDKFDYSYERDKAASRVNIGQELSGQLQSKLFALKERNLISDDNSNLDITSGKYSVDEMDDRIDAEKGGYRDGRSAKEMAEIANHFLYGHWSYYAGEYSNTKQIKVTIFIEEIGGSIKTFEAIGSEQGEAMGKIANMVFAYLYANRNYHDPVATFSNLEIIRPNSVDDLITHTESEAYCASQGEGYRLPYYQEAIGMINQPYGPDGNIFLSPDKNYAVSNLQGGSIQLKLVPGKDNTGSSVQRVYANERLSYFCVKGDFKQVSTEEMYSELYSGFYKLRSEYGNEILPEVCRDEYDDFGIKKMKDMVVKIAKKDPSPRINGVIKYCMITYLKNRPELFKEFSLITRL